MTTASPTQDAAQIIDEVPPADAPEVVDAEPEPAEPVEVVAPKSKRKASAQVAKVEEKEPEPVAVVLDDGWEHERIEFHGDQLAIRKPTRQALSGFTMGVSKYVPVEVQNNIIGLFIAKHIAPESYGHVMWRMMDPDDTEYTDDTVGVLVREIIATANPDVADKAK